MFLVITFFFVLPAVKLLHLLHAICEKSPPDVNQRWNQGESIYIKISCLCHRFHSVSPLGMVVLLEAVEAAVGSTLQEVNMVLLPTLTYLRETLAFSACIQGVTAAAENSQD